MEERLGRMYWKSTSAREYILWACGKLIRLDMHCLLSLPILFLISIIIFIQFFLYCCIKLCVRFSEEMYFRYVSITTKNVSICTNNNIEAYPISLNYQKTRMFEESKSYGEYATHAEKLDKITRRSIWKEKTVSHDYDYKNICKKIKLLRQYKANKDVDHLIQTLRSCLQAKGGGILKESLYSRTYIGTKNVIDEYINEICSSLDTLVDIYVNKSSKYGLNKNNKWFSHATNGNISGKSSFCSSQSNSEASKLCAQSPNSPYLYLLPAFAPHSDAAKSFKISIQNLQSIWGNTALFLSGGAMLGMHHFGLCEVLIKNNVEVLKTKISEVNSPAKENLLPKIICGTSAGAVVAAWICTRTDEEICKQLTSDFITSAFYGLKPNNWLLRFWNILNTGYMCDVDHWVRIAIRLYGYMTFLEAYKKTGRVLNITMTRADRNEGDTLILNYKNAPNIVIFTAVLASSSFPFLGLPFHLKEKNDLGGLRDSSEYEGAFFHDGSLTNDIPLKSIQDFWAIRFTIVSQVNLHVFPFTGSRVHGEAGLPINWRGSSGKWRAGFLMSALELFLKENMRFLLRLIAVLDVSPTYRGINFGSLISQSYTGDVTIHPPRLSWRYIKFANDLSNDDVLWFLKVGRIMTYPKLSLIINRMKVDRALQRVASVLCLQSVPSHRSFFMSSPSVPLTFVSLSSQPLNKSTKSVCSNDSSNIQRNGLKYKRNNSLKSKEKEEEETDEETKYGKKSSACNDSSINSLRHIFFDNKDGLHNEISLENSSNRDFNISKFSTKNTKNAQHYSQKKEKEQTEKERETENATRYYKNSDFINSKNDKKNFESNFYFCRDCDKSSSDIEEENEIEDLKCLTQFNRFNHKRNVQEIEEDREKTERRETKLVSLRNNENNEFIEYLGDSTSAYED